MSMQLELTVYGPQLGRLLADDLEEFAYALDEIKDQLGDKRLIFAGAEIAAMSPDPTGLVNFLRALAAVIEGAA